jgi:hypothetical protein
MSFDPNRNCFFHERFLRYITGAARRKVCGINVFLIGKPDPNQHEGPSIFTKPVEEHPKMANTQTMLLMFHYELAN